MEPVRRSRDPQAASTVDAGSDATEASRPPATGGERHTPRWWERAEALALAIWRKYQADDLSLRAMSLTYTTILSCVPFLAVAFSVLKAFGVQNQIEPLLLQALAPLGNGGAEIARRVIRFVNDLQVGVLGVLGLVGLLYTAVSLVGTIEASLNHIWGARQGRSLPQRFRDYLSVILIGPVLVFTALALTAAAQSTALVQRSFEIAPYLAVLVTGVMPYLFLATAFTLLYRFMPNTPVAWSAALVGGVVAGIGWKLAGSAFTAFVAGSARYTAIYSSFAILILFLFWLYVSWIVVLVGAEVAYFYQYPYLAYHGRRRDSHAEHERRALAVLTAIAERHLRGEPPWQLAELGQRLRVPFTTIEELADEFVARGFLLHALDPPGIALARPPEQITAAEILETLRGDADGAATAPTTGVAELLARRRAAVRGALDGVTLRTLAAPVHDEGTAGSQD